jgi:hypothetical protein
MIRVPILRLLGLGAVAGGAALLAWYRRLTPTQQAQADGIAGHCVRGLFARHLGRLARVPSYRVQGAGEDTGSVTTPFPQFLKGETQWKPSVQ